MNYKKYYTPPLIAELLIKQLNITIPKAAIDICCGSCNLLQAAKKRWNNIKLYGVDIIKHEVLNIDIIVSDGRKHAIETKKKYPLVLANPPFDFINKEHKYMELYSRMEEIGVKYKTSRLENEMLLANLLLLANQGTLLIIMPSTFIESEKNNYIREYLANNYHILKIIRLPKETFGHSNISTYALVIKNNIPKRKKTYLINVCFHNNIYQIIGKKKLLQKNVKKGNWHLEKNYSENVYNYDIKRGYISSNLFSHYGIPVLHTAKQKEKWTPSIRYAINTPKNDVYAETGDIIISRIGESAGQWYVHTGKRILISDCLFRLKDPNGIIARKLFGKKYSFFVKGVATRYITIKDFLSWHQSLL